MSNKVFTPENISKLKQNEVFVFGSNKAGNHVGGAARVAVEKFGARAYRASPTLSLRSMNRWTRCLPRN